MKTRKGAPFSNSKARIEKKIAAVSKELILALCPEMTEEQWGINDSPLYTYQRDVWVSQWMFMGTDGAFELLKRFLIASEGTYWNISRWRAASRREIIRHCRQLVAEGIRWDIDKNYFFRSANVRSRHGKA